MARQSRRLEITTRHELYALQKPSAYALDATLLSAAIRNDNQHHVENTFDNIKPDTIARLLFTSGSTGTPKAVINTHLMLTSNQEANLVVCPFLKETPPRLVDWLPWSHTFGCNYCLNIVLRNGGTMYIDEGKPAPHLISKSIRNIKEIRPNMYFNVPAWLRYVVAGFGRRCGIARSVFWHGADILRCCQPIKYDMGSLDGNVD